MLGQPASSQTVCRPSRLTRSLSSVNSGPVRSRVLIQDGLRSIGVWAFLTSRRRSLRPSGATAVTWSGYAGNAGDRPRVGSGVTQVMVGGRRMGLEVGRIRDVLEDPTAAERTPGLRSLQPGDPDVLGRYVLLGRLGAGGMGTVYLAKAADPNGVERQVAVKMIRPELADDPAFLDRFAGEVAAARKVAGFCTARVLDAVLTPPDPYFVTEYIPGPPLDRAIREQGTLSGSELEALAVGMAAALVAIHAAGLVHRDLKPSNVLLSPYGPRVIDFGIARALPDGLARTEADTVFGTLAWTAPERLIGGRVGPAADVFSWGALIVYAATGRPPFGDGPPLQVAESIRTGTPDLRGLPPKLHRLVGAALAKDPAARPTAQALLLDLCGPSGDTTQAATELVRSGWHYQPPPPPPAQPRLLDVCAPRGTPPQPPPDRFRGGCHSHPPPPPPAQRRPAGPQGTRPLTRPMGAAGPAARPSQTTRYDRIAAQYATPPRP